MSLFSDYFSPESLSVTLARVTGYAQAAGLALTNFVKVSVPYQLVQTVTRTANYSSVLVSQLVRGRASLDTATDPGDVDPYDPTNASAPEAPGMLDEYGRGHFGTARTQETFASGPMTITNASGGAIYIAPEQVTFTSDILGANGLYPTYRNKADATVYTNPDGTATIADGATLTVTIIAEEIGIASNAGAGHVSLTTSLGTGVSATNASAILASAREDADAYRARCRIAAAFLSLGGPADAYRFIALGAQKDEDDNVFFFPPWAADTTTAIGIDVDGNFATFPNARGTSLGINRVQVSESSATGSVIVTFASAGGDPGAQVLTDISALLDEVYWPECTTRVFQRATPDVVNFVGTIKARAGAGVSVATIEDAADAALEAAFTTYDIGGFDRILGAGTIYKQEYESTINGSDSHVYKVTLATPSGDTALAAGHVATLGTTTWTVTVA